MDVQFFAFQSSPTSSPPEIRATFPLSSPAPKQTSLTQVFLSLTWVGTKSVAVVWFSFCVCFWKKSHTHDVLCGLRNCFTFPVLPVPFSQPTNPIPPSPFPLVKRKVAPFLLLFSSPLKTLRVRFPTLRAAFGPWFLFCPPHPPLVRIGVRVLSSTPVPLPDRSPRRDSPRSSPASRECL